MNPAVWFVATKFGRILTFPIAFVVGVIGYYAETKFRNQEPTPVRGPITREREERHTREQMDKENNLRVEGGKTDEPNS